MFCILRPLAASLFAVAVRTPFRRSVLRCLNTGSAFMNADRAGWLCKASPPDRMGMGVLQTLRSPPVPTPTREPALRSVVRQAASSARRNPCLTPLKGREQNA